MATPPFFKILRGEKFGIALEHHCHFINILHYLISIARLHL